MKRIKKMTVGTQIWHELQEHIFKYYPRPMEKIRKSPELLADVIQWGYFNPTQREYTLLRHITAALTLEKYREIEGNLSQALAYNVKKIYGEQKEPEKIKKLHQLYEKTTLATNLADFEKSVLDIYFN